MNRISILKCCVFPALLAGLLLAPGLARAASYTNSASGNWSAAGSWSDGAVPPAGGETNAVLVFNPAAADNSTNDLAGAFLANQVRVLASQAVTLRASAGSSLVLGGELPVVSNASNGTFTIYSPVTLDTSVTMGCTGTIAIPGIITETTASSIIKTGTGTLSLSATNTYTGGTVVNAGTLLLGNGRALGSGTLTINGGTVSGNVALTNNNTIVVNGNCGLINNLNTGSGSFAISQPLSITGNFTIPGAITGPDGLNTLNTLDVRVVIPGTTSGVLLSAPVTLRSNQTFTVSVPVTSSVVIGGAIRDEGAGYGVTFGGSTYFDPQWTGQLCLTGSNTYTGATTINTGVAVQIGAGGVTGSLNPGSTIVLNSGGRVVFSRNNAILQGVDFGAITGAGEVVCKGGTLTLNSNTYTGATAVYGGTLCVGSIPNAGVNSELGAYPAPGAGGLLLGGYVGSGGTFKYVGGTTSTDRGFTLGRSSTINISSNNVTVLRTG